MKNKITLLLLLIVLIGTCYAGRVEFNDTIISGMSEEKYELVRSHIGGNSRSAIVAEYLKNKQYYDSLKY